jgi:hypothetical protein
VNILNRNFARVLMMWVYSHVCSGVLWGMWESVVSDSGRRQWFFLLGMWYWEWEEKASRSMEFELCSLYVTSSNRLNLCIYVLYHVFKQNKIYVFMFFKQTKFMYLCSVHVLYYIISLCSGGFTHVITVMCWFGVCWGHDTDVIGRDVYGWVRQLDMSPSTCHWSVEVFVSQGPHQGDTVVFEYLEVSCEHYDPNIYTCIRT